ncbi:MAG: hypothetical protein Q4G59_10500, partial [Planctomycetia bacterium]|nr:hypothetical protein [Planctomycetia bacterium]
MKNYFRLAMTNWFGFGGRSANGTGKAASSSSGLRRSGSRKGGKARQGNFRQRLTFEPLEERTLLSATTWEVNTPIDVAADSWDTTDNVVSLREAIARAVAGDTINFDSRIDWSLEANKIVLSNGELTIDKSLTIDAMKTPGVTVDANQTSGVFLISCETEEIPLVELIGLTITGGEKAEGAGGGILNVGNLTISNSEISGNSASKSYGGGILNAGNLTMTNSTVSGNIGSYGGGICNEGESALLINCTVYNNMAYNGAGIGTEAGLLTLSNCTVVNNRLVEGSGVGGVEAWEGDILVNISVSIDPTGTGATCQWYRSSSLSGGWTIIEDATSTVYTPGLADAGYYLKVEVQGLDGYTEVFSAVTSAPVTRSISKVTLSISNGSIDTPYVRDVITATVAPSVVSSSNDVQWQWYRTDSQNISTAIESANEANYTITTQDIGCSLKVVAKGINGWTGELSASTKGNVLFDVGDTMADATAIEFSNNTWSFTQSLTNGYYLNKDVDLYCFEVTESEIGFYHSFEVNSLNSYYALEPCLRLFDKDGNQLEVFNYSDDSSSASCNRSRKFWKTFPSVEGNF